MQFLANVGKYGDDNISIKQLISRLQKVLWDEKKYQKPVLSSSTKVDLNTTLAKMMDGVWLKPTKVSPAKPSQTVCSGSNSPSNADQQPQTAQGTPVKADQITHKTCPTCKGDGKIPVDQAVTAGQNTPTTPLAAAPGVSSGQNSPTKLGTSSVCLNCNGKKRVLKCTYTQTCGFANPGRYEPYGKQRCKGEIRTGPLRGKVCNCMLFKSNEETCKSCDAAPGVSPGQNAPTKSGTSAACPNCNGKKKVLRCLSGTCLYINPLSNSKCKMCDSYLFKFNSEKCTMC